MPNAQLVKEKAHIASLYSNKSIAEQNSLDLAWDLLMDKKYRILHRAIFLDEAELQRFRQLVVNILLATDIFVRASVIKVVCFFDGLNAIAKHTIFPF